MDYFQKNKILIAAVIVLIILNVVSIGTFWFGFIHPPMKGMHPFGNQPPPEQFIEKELNLNAPQIEQFHQLRDVHLSQVKGLIDIMQKVKNEAYKELLIESPNKQKVDSLFEVSGKLQVQLEKMTFVHIAKLRTLCTKEQVPVFDRLFQDIMFKFHGHEGPPPSEPPH